MDQTDQTCEGAICRELQEELGLTLDLNRLRYWRTSQCLYPYQGRDVLVMCVLYYMVLTRQEIDHIVCTDDVSQITWFDETNYDP